MLVWIDLSDQMIMDFWTNLSRTLYICDSRCTKNKNEDEDSSFWYKVNLHFYRKKKVDKSLWMQGIQRHDDDLLLML